VNHPTEILLFAGRLHPLLVHLPIGMILLLAILEVAAWYPKLQKANSSAGFILAVATPLAMVTALCGWLLSLGGGYDAKLLFWHQWLGIATAVGCLAAAIFFRLGKHFAYHVSLFTTAAVLGAAGHLGGSLTHGSDYLTEYAPALVKKFLGAADAKSSFADATNQPSDVSVFASHILPVLKQNCTGCHGPQKAKGGLRLDSYAALLKGGERGSALKPGDVERSLFLHQLMLPLASDDHMPPEGKPQPSADEIALLKWWVETGASDTKKAAELNPPANIQKILQSR
jgi:uncharacterized membrane protein/mono/diheme cytochrome c family protein